MFFEQLEKICKERGTTPTTVTVKLGFGKGSMSQWKKGSSPNSDTLLKFAEYFGVSTDYLLIGDENNFNDKEGREKMKKNTENNGLDIFEQIFKVAEQRRPGFMSELLKNLQQDGGMENILNEVAQATQKNKFPTLSLVPKVQYVTIEDMEKFKNEIIEAIKASKIDVEFGKEKSPTDGQLGEKMKPIIGEYKGDANIDEDELSATLESKLIKDAPNLSLMDKPIE